MSPMLATAGGGGRGGSGSRATIVVKTSLSVWSGSCRIHHCSVGSVVVVLVFALVNNRFVVVGLVLLNDAWIHRKERK
jgi:hypothetical protein